MNDNKLKYLICTAAMQSLELKFGISHFFHPLAELLICSAETIRYILDNLLEQDLNVRAQ